MIMQWAFPNEGELVLGTTLTAFQVYPLQAKRCRGDSVGSL